MVNGNSRLAFEYEGFTRFAPREVHLMQRRSAAGRGWSEEAGSTEVKPGFCSSPRALTSGAALPAFAAGLTVTKISDAATARRPQSGRSQPCSTATAHAPATGAAKPSSKAP